ncbi:MAG TPA: HAMP domain-containing sensor histidine kinase [Chthoniobacteraceae bacterium]|jgi:two-component system sensor histidine kinase CpxA|nr:HAMP domain-containing sensor histidine kinase [Chthoniobacteraceae bacterium]
MKARFPLYAKILGWFFVNLLVLVVVFLILVNAQFRFDLGWVFSTAARQRVDTMRNLIVNELNTTRPDEWDRVLEGFSEAYHARLGLYDENGDRLLGTSDFLPPTVRAQLLRPGTEHGQDQFLRTTDPTRYWLLMSAQPDNLEAGGPMNVLLVAESSSVTVGGLVMDLRLGWLLIAGSALFSVLFWLPLLRGITRSIGQMTDATKQIAEGQFNVRVPARRHDELGVLAEAINQMGVRLDGFVKGQARFLGDVAHELCSPLARLQMALGILEQRAGEKEKTYAAMAIEKAGQISQLVNELLAFSKASFAGRAVDLRAVRVRDAVDEAIQYERTEASRIETCVPEDIHALADAELLTRALSNLLRNAIRFGAEAGPIEIRAERQEDRVTITISDNGEGVPEEELPRIFDAFYRIDASRNRQTGGSGLGLAIVRSCVVACNGVVAAENRAPHGLAVHLTLPATEEKNGVANGKAVTIGSQEWKSE